MKNQSIPQLRKKLTRVFNEYIRLRDKDKGCISCGQAQIKHAGHYFSTSQCPQGAMRFNETNVNGQCVRCNSFLEGNRQGYREGLIKRYGPHVIENLDICRSLKQEPWLKWQYETLIRQYKHKIKLFNDEKKGPKDAS